MYFGQFYTCQFYLFGNLTHNFVNYGATIIWPSITFINDFFVCVFTYKKSLAKSMVFFNSIEIDSFKQYEMFCVIFIFYLLNILLCVPFKLFIMYIMLLIYFAYLH